MLAFGMLVGGAAPPVTAMLPRVPQRAKQGREGLAFESFAYEDRNRREISIGLGRGILALPPAGDSRTGENRSG